MHELYEALIEGVPSEIKVKRLCRGCWRAYAETEFSAGVASLLLENKQPYTQCREPEEAAGQPLRDWCAGIVSGDPGRAALGCAALNAWYNSEERLRALGASVYTPRSREGDIFRLLSERCTGKKVSTIGHFPDSAVLRGRADLRIFEKEPRPGDYPEEAEEALLPESDYVFITGMALINGTLPRLLELSAGKYVVLTGPSVPFAPLWFARGVHALSGVLVQDFPACLDAVRSPGGKAIWDHLCKTVLLR